MEDYSLVLLMTCPGLVPVRDEESHLVCGDHYGWGGGGVPQACSYTDWSGELEAMPHKS